MKTLCVMDGLSRGGSGCDATPPLSRGVEWLAASGICIGTNRASLGAGVAVGRSGTHLAFLPAQFLPHASVAAWLHWLCWP